MSKTLRTLILGSCRYSRALLTSAAVAMVFALSVGGTAAADNGAQKPRPQPGQVQPGEAFAEEKKLLESPEYQKSFPNLGSNYEVLGNRTNVYNCISWAIGDTDCMDLARATVAHFDNLFKQHGYSRLPTRDYTVRAGYEKVVLYAVLKADGTLDVTHACIITPDGKCTSKLGQGPLIRHDIPERLNGPTYGEPIAVYERPKQGR